MKPRSQIRTKEEDAQRGDYIQKIDDYELYDADITAKKNIMLTEDEVKDKYPTDFFIHEERKQSDKYLKLQQNELLIVNLPKDVTEQQIKDICNAKGVKLRNIDMEKAFNNISTAYVTVTLPDEQQVDKLKQHLKNSWIQDKKLKAKTVKDIPLETFDDRTIVLKGIPDSYKQDDIAQVYDKFGSVVRIEMPTYDNVIKESLYKKNKDQFNKQRQEKDEKQMQMANEAIKHSLEVNQQYDKFLQQQLGEEETRNTLDMAKESGEDITLEQALENKKYESISSIITQLQAEGVEVNQAMRQIQELKTEVENEIEVPSLSSGISQEEYQQQIENKKEGIERIIKYLKQNKENVNLEESQKFDSIEKLQNLSKGELAFAYDSLVILLQEREKLIEQRIKQSINHLGSQERILQEGKDYSREVEDVTDVNDTFGTKLKIEQILSINEQINNVTEFKNLSPEDRFYQIATKTLNPFLEANFNHEQIAEAQTQVFDQYRQITYPDQTLPPSLARRIYHSKPFKQRMANKINDKVNELRNEMDVPFDELYHKERVLVENVIKAQKALEDKEASLPNPFGNKRLFNPQEFINKFNREELSTEHQFLQDKKQQAKEHAGKEQFYVSEQDQLQQMVKDGSLSEKDYLRLRQVEKENRTKNFGYAFVTFSHSDEAKLAAYVLQESTLDGLTIDVFNKGNLDHQDFDQLYNANQSKNDAKLVDEMERLRNEKKELRNFEKNMDNELPSLKKLKQFRDTARDTIENKPGITRDSEQYKRTPQEEELLNEKIRQLQKENPKVDYTELFDTERAEKARKALHKKAFASYKAFEFLKNGVSLKQKNAKEEKQVEQQKRKYDYVDPYSFPALDETVAKLFTKDITPKVLDTGDTIKKPGRRFKYTEQDFIEAYMGKDNARAPTLDTEKTQIFGFNEEWKQKYPIDKYRMTPVLQSQKKKFEEEIGMEDLKTPIGGGQSEFTKFVEQIDPNEPIDYDVQHPTDPNRTLLNDAAQKLESYFKWRQSKGEDTYHAQDLGKMRREIRNEYFPKEPKEKRFNPNQANKPVDSKQQSKFEPEYEGEDSQTLDQVQQQSQERIQKSSQSNKGRNIVHGYKFQEEFINLEESETPLNSEDKRLNRELLYEYIDRKNKDPNFKNDDMFLKKVEKLAKENDVAPEQILEEYKDKIRFTFTNDQGDFIENYKYGIRKEEYKGRESQVQRGISDYAKESESEREDEDILQHYRQKMMEQKQQQAQDDKQAAQNKLLQSELDENLNDIPEFEGFFNSISQGKHPFEDDKYKFDEARAQKDREEQEEVDEELQERELKGRLLGEKLTPRQFGLLYQVDMDEITKLRFMKNKKREEFITTRDMIRLGKEQMESYRRKQVMEGRWSEEESHQKLQQYMKSMKNESLDQKEMSQRLREYKDMKRALSEVAHPKMLFEKEYYFDEGLGESLQEHVEHIKKNYPVVQVEVRRDRDGFAIVKTKFKPKFKYDLNHIENYNPQEEEDRIKQTLEGVVQNAIQGQDNNQDIMQNLEQSQLEQVLSLMTPKDGNFDLDQRSQNALEDLVKERMQGIYKDDLNGFLEQLKKLTEKVTYDKSKTVNTPFLKDAAIMKEVQDNAYEQIYRDRKLIAYEMGQQIALRVKEHLYHKERKESDFVKGKRNELDIFSTQVRTNEEAMKQLEDKYNQMVSTGQEKEEETFDKESYQELKNEIKRRKDAKERLLQQGFPDLKPYIRI